jgi:periplasmic protein TonB
MSYVTQHKSTDPKGLIIAIAINALVLGTLILSPVVVEPRKPTPGTTTFDVPKKDPPPPDTPVAVVDPANPLTPPPIYVPPSPFPLPPVDDDGPTTTADPAKPPPTFGGTGTDTVGVSGTGTDIGTTPKVETPADPPVPIFKPAQRDPKFIGNFQPEYPQSMAAREIEGSVRIKVLVGSNGRVREAIIVQASHAAFGDATIKQALRAWRFIPATRDGAPVEDWQILTVRFDMQ